MTKKYTILYNLIASNYLGFFLFSVLKEKGPCRWNCHVEEKIWRWAGKAEKRLWKYYFKIEKRTWRRREKVCVHYKANWYIIEKITLELRKESSSPIQVFKFVNLFKPITPRELRHRCNWLSFIYFLFWYRYQDEKERLLTR